MKTASKEFPKKYLNTVEMAERGGHVVVTSEAEGVELIACLWKDGGKNKKTKEIIRKNIIGSCGTTLPGEPHTVDH